MKQIDYIFLIYILSLILYDWITPGYQLPPARYKYEDRMNWKPGIFFWINAFIIFVYLSQK